MIVGSEFPGDNNDTLMDVQHAAYGEMVVRLFTGPRDRYLAAAALLRVDDKLSGGQHRSTRSGPERHG